MLDCERGGLHEVLDQCRGILINTGNRLIDLNSSGKVSPLQLFYLLQKLLTH